MKITCATKSEAAKHAVDFLETALKENQTVRIVNTNENSVKMRIFCETGKRLITITIVWLE